MIGFDIDTAPAERLIQHAANNWPRVYDAAISRAASAAKRSLAAAGHYRKVRGVNLGFPKRAAVTAMLRPGTAPGGALGMAKLTRVEKLGAYSRRVAYVGRIGNTALRFQYGSGAALSDSRNRQWAYIQLIKPGTPEAERDRIKAAVQSAPPNVPRREYVAQVAQMIDRDWVKDLAGNIRRICAGQMAKGRALA
jgi:hypothetical protein